MKQEEKKGMKEGENKKTGENQGEERRSLPDDRKA